MTTKKARTARAAAEEAEAWAEAQREADAAWEDELARNPEVDEDFDSASWRRRHAELRMREIESTGELDD